MLFYVVIFFQGGMDMKRLLVLGPEDKRREYIAAARRGHYDVIIGCSERIAPQDATVDPRILLVPTDREEVISKAVHNGVSGILGLGSEEAVTAAYAARRLGLPGGAYAQIRMMQDLLLFRAFQVRQHFDVPQYRDITHSVNVQGMDWPILVSPSDDVTIEHTEIVSNMEQMRAARRRAMQRGRHGRVIAQHLPAMEHPGAAYVMTDLVIRGGALYPLLWNECILSHNSRDAALLGCRYPARISERSRTFLTEECKRLVRILDLQDAELGMVAYIERGATPYILSVGPFLGAIRLPGYLSQLYRHDLLQDVVQMAAGDRTAGGGYRMPENDVYTAYSRVMAHHSGVLRSVRFHKVLQPYIRHWESSMRQSGQIYTDGEQGDEVGRLFLQFHNENEMERILGEIGNLIDIGIDAL